MSNTHKVQTGVIGVGSMGRHHARVYSQLHDCQLVGIADADGDRASEIAEEYGTDVLSTEELVEQADAVTISTPTQYHYDLAMACIDAGTHILVEKPLVKKRQRGTELIDRADDSDIVLQVGHIERFNPVTQTLYDVVSGLNVIAIKAERLGPPPNRRIEDSAVTDLMIHDIDIVRSLLDASVASVSATGNADGRYATATLEFGDVITNLTASRLTQRKVRQLTITAEECYVVVDYIDQDIQIHRNSVPEYVVENGDVRYRHESLIENPAVDNGEPLECELRSFLTSIRDGIQPKVTGRDGLQALELAKEINEKAFGSAHKTVEVLQE